MRRPGREMLTVGPAHEVSRSAPIFFLSYAHSQSGSGGVREPNPSVLRLFNDLSMHVAEMVPHSGGEPGFMDQSMDGGERWNKELLTAAGTCQAFLALVSLPYLTSKWCAMEWDAFSRRPITREVREAPMNGTTILPVLWIKPTQRMPRPVREAQWFTPQHRPDPEITAQYQREGLYGLLQLPADDAYKAITWRLAQRIVELMGQFEVAEQIPSGSGELSDVFRDEDGNG